MNDVRLTKAIPKRRLRLISGDGSEPPSVGDLGETDQCFTGPLGRQMVLVEFVTANGASEWEAEAYWSELEEIGAATNQTLQRTGAAKKRFWFQRLFTRGPGR
jgi:hypothetical protein